jgi:NitT/TauT family transport system permease protein
MSSNLADRPRATLGKISPLSVSTPLALLLLWELGARVGWMDTRILPAPSAIFGEFIELFSSGEIWPHLLATTARFLIGTVVGVVPGVLLGLTMGIFPRIRAAFQPLVMLFYPLPRIALFPLMLMIVGLNEKANILMIALGPFFTMLISTMAAVLSIDGIYKDVAHSFRTNTRDLYFKVMLPASLPTIFSGLHISIGIALMTTTAVEFLNAETGLGYLIWHSWQILSIKLSITCLILSGLIGAIFYWLFQKIEKAMLVWQSATR